jgi:hypothetical protein
VTRALRAAVVVAALAALAALAAPAAADGPIDLPETPAEITIPDSWRTSEIPEVRSRPVVAYESAGGALVVITRAGAYNPQAWAERTRAKYCDEVERGVSDATNKYQRRRRSIQKVNGVPTMDLEISREVDGVKEDVVMRFVFFRTYTLTLAAVGPSKERSTLQSIAKSFGPPKGYVP